MTDDPYQEDKAERLARFGPHARQFTDREKASEAGKKGAATRARLREQRRALAAWQLQEEQKAEETQTLLRDMPLTDLLTAAIHNLVRRALTGEIPARNAKEAASFVETAYAVLRTEEGRPASYTVSLSGNVDDLRARLLERVKNDVIELPDPDDEGPNAA